MKRIFSILATGFLTASLFAQAPQKMSYQAVIRNSSNKLVASTTVGMRISILQGSATGTAVYVETQTSTTNINGLASLEIGSGTIVAGFFSEINWANGPYFIKTETDLTGGTAYSVSGTSELLSVPYALFSGNGNPVHYIGENYGGGIVFYVYDGGQHGLIAATTDQSMLIRWYAGSNTHTMALANGIGAGKANTAIIIANQGYGDGETYAARVCNEYSVTVDGVTYGDWYLPSLDEMWQMHVHASGLGLSTLEYWSSNEYDIMTAWVMTLGAFSEYGEYKSRPLCSVRAIRAF